MLRLCTPLTLGLLLVLGRCGDGMAIQSLAKPTALTPLASTLSAEEVQQVSSVHHLHRSRRLVACSLVCMSMEMGGEYSYRS